MQAEVRSKSEADRHSGRGSHLRKVRRGRIGSGTGMKMRPLDAGESEKLYMERHGAVKCAPNERQNIPDQSAYNLIYASHATEVNAPQ